MTVDDTVAITMVITNEVLLYITLPLQARLLYVLLKPSSKKDLDSSFHTIIVNSTIRNLLVALNCCFILEPSASGLFFEFYQMMGPYFSKLDMIKATTVGFIQSILHLVLAANRFTAIAFPLRHKAWWGGRRLFWFCVGMWIVMFCFSIPLILPGSTRYTTWTNLYGVAGIEYAFTGNYYLIYAMSCTFPSVAMEVTSLLFYVGMLIKFNDFRKNSTSNNSDVKRLTRGVLRTTFASLCIAGVKWTAVIFMIMVYWSHWTRGRPLIDGNYFSAMFRFLTAINNTVTPWVMVMTFKNIRILVFGKGCKARKPNNGTTASNSSNPNLF